MRKKQYYRGQQQTIAQYRQKLNMIKYVRKNCCILTLYLFYGIEKESFVAFLFSARDRAKKNKEEELERGRAFLQ